MTEKTNVNISENFKGNAIGHCSGLEVTTDSSTEDTRKKPPIKIKYTDPLDEGVPYGGTVVCIKEGSVPENPEDGDIIENTMDKNKYKENALVITPQRTGGNSAHTKDYNVTLFPYSASGVFNMLKKESKNITLSYEEIVEMMKLLKTSYVDCESCGGTNWFATNPVNTSKGMLVTTTDNICSVDMNTEEIHKLCTLPSFANIVNDTGLGSYTGLSMPSITTYGTIGELNNRIFFTRYYSVNDSNYGIAIYELIETDGVYSCTYVDKIDGYNKKISLSFMNVGDKLLGMFNCVSSSYCSFYEIALDENNAVTLKSIPNIYNEDGNTTSLNAPSDWSNCIASVYSRKLSEDMTAFAIASLNIDGSTAKSSTAYTLTLSGDKLILRMYNSITGSSTTSDASQIVNFSCVNDIIYTYVAKYSGTNVIELIKVNCKDNSSVTIFNGTLLGCSKIVGKTFPSVIYGDNITIINQTSKSDCSLYIIGYDE